MNIIKLFGSSRIQDQLPLIEKGFQENDKWTIASMELPFPTIIYCNDSGNYDEAIKYKQEFGGFLILNVLDIPEHLFPNFDLNNLKSKLLQADSITCISKTVQNQIKKYLNLDSTIIYNPAKEIYEIPGMYEKRNFLKFLHVGRRSDPIKRYDLVVNLIKSFYSENQLINVGQDPGIGKISGLVSNDYLTFYYNQADYVLVFTKNGGIELPIIEAFLAGKFPLVCNDCECAMEFAPEFSADPNIQSLSDKIYEIESNKDKYLELVKQYQKQYLSQFYYRSITSNIIDVYNSKK